MNGAQQHVGAIAAIDHLIAYYREKEGLVGDIDDGTSVEHHNARAALVDLIVIATKFDGFLGGRSLPDTMTTHVIHIKAMDFYRLQEALKRVGGAV